MQQLRFIFTALITFLFVTNTVFLRRIVFVLLCGVPSFNSASSYTFLDKYDKAYAATPSGNAVVTSKDFSVVQKDQQKIAGCLFGVCLPKIPVSIPSVPSGGQKEPIPPANLQSNVSLAGKWQSDWGLVEFNSDLTGHWNQGGGIGQIKDGTYDPQTRKLVFHYYQPWNDMNGTATLTLSEDGNRLSGNWSQQRNSTPPGSGGSGGWVMTRDPSFSNQDETAKKEPSKASLRAYAESYIKDWGTHPQNGSLPQVSPINSLTITKTDDPAFPYHGTVTTVAYPTLVFSFYYRSNGWITEAERNRIQGR